ncbi:hypothetical protein QTO34_016045 [Cnephaeus nilssonii]|uniref:glutaminase n=1 Tax=Cnephaeus nilssonii TaxID=3371016 RepID=A0AA40I582_CNENI|nr:hypothetical protein QTO34_016045 [Eptesicus nilssonii]
MWIASLRMPESSLEAKWQPTSFSWLRQIQTCGASPCVLWMVSGTPWATQRSPSASSPVSSPHLCHLGTDYVHKFGGKEPSGLRYNKLSLNEERIPHNLMVNTGAIVISSLIKMDCNKAENVMAATLANGGIWPITGESMLSIEAVCNTLSLLHSCSMYDFLGQFAFHVSLPAKSAMSRTILLVVPNVMGMMFSLTSTGQAGEQP